MRRFDKIENVRKANLLAEQRYLESKGLISENILNDTLNPELLEENWKNWLAAGLITLSTIGGVYKFNQNKIQNDKAGTELIQASKSILDKMSNDEKQQLLQSLVDKGRISSLQSGLHLVGNFDDPSYQQNKATHDSADRTFMDNKIKEAMQSNPGWFGITKDGKIVAI